MNLGESLVIFLIVICSCKAQRIGFGELDYFANEGEGVARVVLVVSESESQQITVPLIVMSFGEYFTPDRPRLPSEFDTLDLPDAAEYSEDDNGRRDFVRNQTIELTFPPSNNVQEQEVFIPLVDDNINEAIEGFLVILDFERFAIINPAVTMTDTVRGGITLVTIEDNDSITLMFEEDEYSVEEAEEDFPNTIFVTKGGIETEQQLEVLVQLSSTMASTASKGPNMDYDINNIQRLIFSPSSNTLPVPFEIFNDEIPEGIEQFSLFLIVGESKSAFTLGLPSRTTVSIVDDDDLVIGFEEPSYTVIEGEMVEVCIKINEPEGEFDLVAPISIMSMDGTAILADNDYEEVATFFVFPNFDGTRKICFNVTTTENDISEPSKNFMIEFNFAIATSPNVKTDIRITNIVIQDDDAPQDPCASVNCHADADCVSAGSDTFQCICRRGFVGNGASCRVIPSLCRSARDCHPNAACVFTSGFKLTCQCNDGYEGDGKQNCDDACSDNDCHAKAECIKTNNAEGFQCSCQSGYVGDGRSCENINECLSSSHRCHSDAICVNTDGGHHCLCKSGFTGDGIICLPISDTVSTTNPPATTTPAITPPSTEPPLCISEQERTTRSTRSSRHSHTSKSTTNSKRSSSSSSRSTSNHRSTSSSSRSSSRRRSSSNGSMRTTMPCVTEPKQDSSRSSKSHSIRTSRSHSHSTRRSTSHGRGRYNWRSLSPRRG